MLVFGDKPETLPIAIRRDATTGLPLLREQDAIMQIILAYLALPYSIAEYGCGKKASMIIDQLLGMEIPPYAIARGMALEADMSPAALAQTDHRQREHALVADNPLHRLADSADPRLQAMLAQNSPDTRVLDDGAIQAGPYHLQHKAQVQFVSARSHIYPILTFWDEDKVRAVERVIDPSLQHSDFFPVEAIREHLHAPETLLFEAPLLARFRLDPLRLTQAQRRQLQAQGIAADDLDHLPHAEHAALVRRLNGAEPDSIGDPDTWTYANNIQGGEYVDPDPQDADHLSEQLHNTGRGDGLGEARRRLLRAREQRTGEASSVLAELRELIKHSDVRRIALADARWSQRQLAPLADTAMTLTCFHSLCALANTLHSGADVLQHLEDSERLQQMRGLGVRLRRRIDWLGRVSVADDGRIDARALSPGFVAATVETIRQMNRAGLSVFIDRVGNLHGLLLDEAAADAIRSGSTTPAELPPAAIVHGSHIDTVNDAGKFDGRLGVLAGVETAHVLTDLERHFDLPVPGRASAVHCQVSAFIGEEMTFTGEGVSMPGSAAVAGRASAETIYAMRNHDGERFGDCLDALLRELRKHQSEGSIELCNDLAGTDPGRLREACSDPQAFYTPHSFERHIEQGPFLDRADVPLVMVGTIMGIRQEDFHFRGERAEAAALEFNRCLRELTHETRFADVRITVGLLEGVGESRILENVHPALRWTFEGELNHAGATPTADRRDPGVAAARLTREFLNWFERVHAERSLDGLFPLVGNVRVSPGTNRNVIPGSVSLTLALAGTDASARDRVDAALEEDLAQTLEGYAIGTLARRVAGGGEGVRLCRVEPVSYTNLYTGARLSIDLRADRQAVSDAFRARIDDILERIRADYGVGIDGEPQQQLPPFRLEETGQALLMERSYGGSHNPRETEMLSDIVRGSLLQLAVTREVLGREQLDDLNLFHLVEARMPAAWRKRMPRFTSGALHDSCNIAARAGLGSH